VAGAIGAVALCTTAVGLAAQPAPSGGRLRDRLTLAGVSIAGKTIEEARALATDLSARILGVPLIIGLGDKEERTDGARLGATIDPRGALDQAVSLSAESGSLLDRLRERFTGPPAVDLPLVVQVREPEIARALAGFGGKLGSEPRNARFTKVNGKFKTTPPRPGKALDTAALAQAVYTELNGADLREKVTGSLQSAPDRAVWLEQLEPITIAATTRDLPPRIAKTELQEITARLASFSTPLGGSSRNRVHNIRLACRAIDGTVLLPGDVFSYNDTVGPRVASAGFKEAPVIIQGELQPGTGGGICQVSSTLYNAVLFADLEVVRRSHHAFPVHYVPAGRDATVVDGAIDFKFKNRNPHPVALDAKVSGSRVVFHIYGHPDDKKDVELRSSGVSRVGATVATISDPRLPRGRRVVEKPPKDGKRVTISRLLKADGEVIRTEVVSRDFYRTQKGVVRVGTAERKTAKPVRTPVPGGSAEGGSAANTSKSPAGPPVPARPVPAPAP
jgi:vancomycin resistance protein YoaR